MALLPKKSELNKQIKTTDIKIKDDVKIEYHEGQKFKAKDRVPVQLDPPVKKTIEKIAYAKDVPMYKAVELAVNAYVDSLSESERRIYDSRK